MSLDSTLNDSALFPGLWKDRTPAEQALLRRLDNTSEAEALTPRPFTDDEVPASNWLKREEFLIESPEGLRIAVPMFATWIRVWGRPG